MGRPGDPRDRDERGKAMNAVLPGLGVDGTLLVLGGADEAIRAPAGLLISGRRSIQGWPSGRSAIESQDTPRVCRDQRRESDGRDLRARGSGAEGFDRMMSGQARFKVVLSTGNLEAEEEETVASR